MTNKVRVRFAPSPTGFMHLGNIRAALMNYLYARQKAGAFILRVEDTDEKRNLVEAREKILLDLKWLGLNYDEGPDVGGEYGPYLQSERTDLYKQKLQRLIEKEFAYRCFCSQELLEKKRKMQIVAKMPPRYDRTCLKLSEEEIQQRLDGGDEYLWRFKIDQTKKITIIDMAKGKIVFNMKNFADFALTRRNHTFTFTFANFVDDCLMKITHVARGEDHLTNTATQAALYEAFQLAMPQFWHLPIICNSKGEKLSKRDFGFTLRDLKDAGFVPEAINNYLAIIGSSFKEEIQSLNELTKNFNFENLHSGGAIKYDLEKLTWINHKWLTRFNDDVFVERVQPILFNYYPEAKYLDVETVNKLLLVLKPEFKTLHDVQELAYFYFNEPDISWQGVVDQFGQECGDLVQEIASSAIGSIGDIDTFFKKIKDQAKEKKLPFKQFFGSIRYMLTGKFQGIGMHDLLVALGSEKVENRLRL